MDEWLERMRRKPKAARQRLAFFGAAGVTTVVALFWLVAVSVQFRAADTVVVTPVSDSSGAFSQFFSDATDNFAAVVEPFFQSEASETGSQVVPLSATTSPAEGAATTTPTATTATADEPFRFASSTRAPRPVIIETRPATSSPSL